MPGFSPVIPLELDPSDGFSLTKTYKEVGRQNLKALILTNPGERIMEPAFGAGIRRRLFEPKTGTTYAVIEAEILSQVASYLPYIKIRKIIFDELKDPYSKQDLFNSIAIRIIYYIDALNISDELEVLISI